MAQVLGGSRAQAEEPGHASAAGGGAAKAALDGWAAAALCGRRLLIFIGVVCHLLGNHRCRQVDQSALSRSSDGDGGGSAVAAGRKGRMRRGRSAVSA